MKQPKVSVIIPNWNGQRYLRIVLPSLRRQTFKDFETIVVDNGSTDDSRGYLQRYWPAVRVVGLPSNLGFAKAVNRALAVARGTYVALLNNDIEADRRWLAELVNAIARNPRISFAASKMLRYHDRSVLDEAGHDVSVYGLTVPRGFDQPDSARFATRRATTVASGGASLFRRRWLDELGGFDEDYFFYYEDVDLSLRAAWRGDRGEYVPTAVVYHHGGGSVGRLSYFTRVNITRNLLITILKDFPLRLLTLGGWRIIFHQGRLLSSAIKEHWLRAWLVGWAKFWLAVPRTLLKRRRVMATRRVSSAAFIAGLRQDYPLPSKFLR